jgi:hypothetical protein
VGKRKEKKEKKMNCWHCNTELIWNIDFSYEDYMIEGDGIVTILSCPNEDCGVDRVEVYCDLGDDEEE